MMVEFWSGETEDDFFCLEIASDSSIGCFVVGAISEREMMLKFDMEEIFESRNKNQPIQQLIQHFKWKMSDLNIFEYENIFA